MAEDSTGQKIISRRTFLKGMGGAGIACVSAALGGCQNTGVAPGGEGWLPQQYNIPATWPVQVRGRIPIDPDNPSIARDDRKCILCGQCIEVCQRVQTVHDYYELPLIDSIPCVNCGQCTLWCPSGAISERDDIDKVVAALQNKNMHVVVQTAPATRVALGEEFGMPPGSIVEGKQVAALKALGFGAVFDTNFSADLTIMEEGSEFLSRLTKKGHAAHKPLPQFTSCSPGWVKFCEMFYPDLLDCMSTCKSPQQMLGVLSKTYYAKKKGIPPEKIFSVSIMPCTAKKSECLRPEINAAGRFYGKTNMRDVDAVLTTRELGRLIKMKNINLTLLKDAPYDSLMGESTGAAVIFGASGGVMESAVRTTYYLVTGDNPPDLLLNLKPVRGLDGCKEAALAIPGVGEVRVAVVHGLGNARRMLDYVRSERKAGRTPSFHFIEFMACPGGCIGGGGQPRSSLPPDDEVMQARIDSIYAMDAKSYKKRLSYENREVQKLYEDFLGKPNGELAEKLLHTGYEDKSGHFIAKDDAPATCLRRYE